MVRAETHARPRESLAPRERAIPDVASMHALQVGRSIVHIRDSPHCASAALSCGRMPGRPATLPLCFDCGAAADAGCGHPRSSRLRWAPAPLRAHLREGLGVMAFTALFALVLIGVGPLLWWLAYGWPPEGWIELAGALGIALVSLPGWVIAIGVLLSAPSLWPERRWALIDREGGVRGSMSTRRGRLVRAELSIAARTTLARPTSTSLTSTLAIERSDDPTLVLAAALVGLAARGLVRVTATRTTGWTRSAEDVAARPVDALALTIAATDERPPPQPWIEAMLLGMLQHGREGGLRAVATDLAERTALAVGFVGDEESGSLRWPEDAPTGPREALRELLDAGEVASGDASAISDALAEWCAREPDASAALAEITGAAARAFVLDPDA